MARQTQELQRTQVLPEAHNLMGTSLGFNEIQLDIPAGASLTQVEHSLNIAITGFNRLGEAREALKPIIGRLLLTVKSGKLYKGSYKNFTEYIMTQVIGRYNLSRSNAFESLRIATAFPTLSSAEYEKYGATKLLLASRVTDETKPNYRSYLERAMTLTVDAFKESIAAERPTSGPNAETKTVTIRCAVAVAERWNALLEGSEVPASDWFATLLDAYEAQQRAANEATNIRRRTANRKRA